MIRLILKNIFALCILLALYPMLQSCECVVKPDCNGTFVFILRDKITGQDLLQGPYAKYNIDSIKIIQGSDTTLYPNFAGIQRLNGNLLECLLNGSSDTLFLKLNSTDTDTLLLSFRHYKRNICCPSGSRGVTNIVFNNTTAMQENGTFILKK